MLPSTPHSNLLRPSAPTSGPLHRPFPLPGTLPRHIFVWLFSRTYCTSWPQCGFWERPLLAIHFPKRIYLQSPTHLPLFPCEPVYRKFLKRGESLILLTIYHPELQLLQNIKDTYRMNIEGIARWAMKLWKAHVGAEGGRQEV